MKKIFLQFALVAMFAMFIFAPVYASASTTWDVRGTYVWNVFGTYFHDITITTQNPDGTFSGYGGWPAGNPALYQTTEQITGQVTGDTFTFTSTYDGPYGAGSVWNMTGSIIGDGTISGTSPWNWSLDGHKAIKFDSDGDGVLGDADLCPNTSNDMTWEVSWGPNRWQVQDGVWYQNKVKKGTPVPTASTNTLAYTYGCNGHQILAMLNDTFGSVMNGHLKYGLSSSVLEDFHKDLADGILDGMYFLETVTVQASNPNAVFSTNTLLSGEKYAFKAYGTANAGDGIEFDADYSYRTPTSTTWTDAVSTYEYLGDTLLDLKVGGAFVNWDNDAVYNTNHTYWYEMYGAGAPASFQIYDVYYPNNTGSLMVDIYAQI